MKFAGANNALELNQKITDQGNKVRQLKDKKAPKVCLFYSGLMQNNYSIPLTKSEKYFKLFQGEIDAAVKILLSLKADYKTAIGHDWKPSAAPAAATAVETPAGDADHLNQLISEQGNKVRDLKAKKAPKVSSVVPIGSLYILNMLL